MKVNEKKEGVNPSYNTIIVRCGIEQKNEKNR